MATYTRQTAKQRGHFSNLPMLLPVVRLSITTEGLRIKRRFVAEIFIPWEKAKVAICKRKSFKSYGAYSGAAFNQKICTIYDGVNRYAFDVSSQFSDFGETDTKSIISEISNHIEISETTQGKPDWKDWWFNFEPY